MEKKQPHPVMLGHSRPGHSPRPSNLRCTALHLLTLLLTALWLWPLLSIGCGGRPALYEKKIALGGPIAVGTHVAYMDRTRERITLVRPYTREIRHIKVGRRPAFMLPSPDDTRLLVLCKGWIAKEKNEKNEDPALHVIDPTDGTATIYPLESPFDEVAVSADNRHAVAYFSASAGPGQDEVFRNPNAVALLNLESGELVHKTVRSFGDVPRGVVFSPPNMTPLGPDATPGEPRTLAVVFATGYLTFLDVTHPERGEVTVRLSLPEMNQDIVGQELVFVPESGTAFLRTASTSDIYVFALTTRQTTDPQQNDFQISINTLPAGSIPGDIAVFQEGAEQKVLVANGASGNVTIIDAHTTQFVTIPVGAPVDDILLYPEEAPTTAVLYSGASALESIHFLTLQNVEENKGHNVSTLNASEPILSVEPLPSGQAALVVHNDSRSVMSVLDLTDQTLSPFTAHSTLYDYAINGSGNLLAGFTEGGDQLGLVDLANLNVRTLQLGHAPVRVLGLRSPGEQAPTSETNTLVVHHADDFGLLTVIPTPSTADSESIYVMSGFLMEEILDDRYQDK